MRLIAKIWLTIVALSVIGVILWLVWNMPIIFKIPIILVCMIISVVPTIDYLDKTKQGR